MVRETGRLESRLESFIGESAYCAYCLAFCALGAYRSAYRECVESGGWDLRREGVEERELHEDTVERRGGRAASIFGGTATRTAALAKGPSPPKRGGRSRGAVDRSSRYHGSSSAEPSATFVGSLH